MVGGEYLLDPSDVQVDLICSVGFELLNFIVTKPSVYASNTSQDTRGSEEGSG